MSPLAKLAALVVCLGAGLGAVWYADKATRDRPARAALPGGTFLAITADADALRRSPVIAQLLGGERGDALGVKSLEEPCGFDPLARIREIAVAVPEEGEPGDFGVAARVDATGEELARCADRIGEKKGKRASFTKQGDTFVIDDAAPGGRRIAYRPAREGSGILLVATPRWLGAMLAALDGTGPRIDSDATHATLRSALEKGGPPSLVVTAALPKAVRERIRRDLDREPGSDDGRETMVGILGVYGAGLAVALGPTEARFQLELLCEAPAQCEATRTWLERKRFSLTRDLAARLVAGPFIDSFQVETRGATLGASARGNADDLARAVQRVLDARGERRPDGRDRAPAPSPRPAPVPDEVIRGAPKPSSNLPAPATSR